YAFVSISKTYDTIKAIGNLEVKINISYEINGNSQTNEIKSIMLQSIQIYDEFFYQTSENSDIFSIDLYFHLECDDNSEFDKDNNTRNLLESCGQFGLKKCPLEANEVKECEEEEEISCSTNTCENGGTCIVINDNAFYFLFIIKESESIVCACVDGWFGPSCQHKSQCGHCVSDKCIGENNCTECWPGWGGEDCDKRVCEGYSLCQNDGFCNISKENRVCTCINNYYG
ncbi:hypothetical protein HZS_1722, partial [Henneguya salminicola]